MSLSVWCPFSNACKCFAYYNCYKALNIIIRLITLFILSLEYCPLPISAMVQGNIILAWQWSGTSIHIYRWSGISHLNIHNGPGQHHSSMSMVWDIRNGLGQHHTSMAMVRGIHSRLQMARDITAQHSQWSRATSNLHGNGLGHPFTFMDGLGYHTST